MEETRTSDDVVRSHAWWATGAGLVPVPLFDLVAVTAIQLDMLKDLARLHDAGKPQENVFEMLRELGKLKQQGILTDDEFEAKKGELLERL